VSQFKRKFQVKRDIAHQPVGIRNLQWLPFHVVSRYRQYVL